MKICTYCNINMENCGNSTVNYLRIIRMFIIQLPLLQEGYFLMIQTR